jgi:hypothetical protein
LNVNHAVILEIIRLWRKIKMGFKIKNDVLEWYMEEKGVTESGLFE